MSGRTIARLFDSYDDAAQSVRDLEAAGFAHADISLVANNADNRVVEDGNAGGNEAGAGAEVGAVGGALAGGGAGVLAGLGLLAIPGVGPVVAAGWLAALAVGAAGGAAAGGLLGALLGAGISKEHAEVFAEGVRRGGALVTVRTSVERHDEASAILDKNAVDPVSRRAEYASSGWSAYNPDGSLITEADLDRERQTERL